MTIPNLHLNDGHTMPQIGLGTASLNDEAVISALDIGAEPRADSDTTGH